MLPPVYACKFPSPLSVTIVVLSTFLNFAILMGINKFLLIVYICISSLKYHLNLISSLKYHLNDNLWFTFSHSPPDDLKKKGKSKWHFKKWEWNWNKTNLLPWNNFRRCTIPHPQFQLHIIWTQGLYYPENQEANFSCMDITLEVDRILLPTLAFSSSASRAIMVPKLLRKGARSKSGGWNWPCISCSETYATKQGGLNWTQDLSWWQRPKGVWPPFSPHTSLNFLV